MAPAGFTFVSPASFLPGRSLANAQPTPRRSQEARADLARHMVRRPEFQDTGVTAQELLAGNPVLPQQKL